MPPTMPPGRGMHMSFRMSMEEEDGLSGEVVGLMTDERSLTYGQITDTFSKANAAMHGLVWLMSSPSVNDSAKASAASAVAALAADGSDNKDRIASTDGAVEALIRLAVEGGDKARACAAMAMANLVEDHVENKLFLASAPNCLQAVTALLRTGSEKARWHGARLVASMAMMPELRESIGAEKGALDELVRLCRSGGDDATCSAACALANLTDSHEANWERMARVHKGFSTLVNVAGGGGLEGRAHAVRALANLAVPYANKTLIAKTPRSLQVLVEALEMDRGATQSNAAAAIGNLAHDHRENKERIAQTPSALTALVASLHNGSDDCRRNSAAALSNICHEHAENIELLMRTAGSLQALVWCVCEARDDCRNNAACCIANLAASSMRNQTAIAQVPGSVDALVDCCRRGGEFTIANAAGALANLAERHTDNKRAIGDTANAVATLVKVACTGKLPSAVSNAACALANLAAEDRRNKRAIAACPGALQILVQLVAASAPDTQSNAACAIANLVADEDDTKSAFAEVPYAFGALVELLRTGTDSGKVNACRALANAVSWHDDNKAQVATVRGSIAAVAALVAEEGPLRTLHTAAALALANLTDAHIKNSCTAAREEGALEALVRIAGHAEEEGRVHAVRCLANLSEAYDNRELIGSTPGALETLLLAIASANDTLATTASFALAKLTESVAANVVALAHHTFNAVEKLTECIVRGSRRARSNAAVCVCHITARRHAVSVKFARTAGAVRALADAASAEIPVHVDARELEFEGGAYAEGVTLDTLARYVTAEQVIEERERGRSTDDLESHEDAKRCCAFAIASMAANKGPQYQHVRPITKVRGVVSSLVWILATQKHSATDPSELHGLRVFDSSGQGGAPLDVTAGMPSVGEETRVWVTEDDDADSGVLSGRGVSARVLPRVNAAAALANLADDDSGNIVSIIRTPGAIEALVASLRQDEWVHLRFHAARALANLSSFYGARTAIAESPGALTALVTVLETNPSASALRGAPGTVADAVRIQAARTLANLASNHLLNKGRVANTTRSVALLVRATTFGSKECRAYAARALGETMENHTPNAITVESHRGSLDGAIMMLTEGLKQVWDEERRWDPAVEAAARLLPHQQAAKDALVPDDYSGRRDLLDCDQPWMLAEACYMLTHLAVTDSLRNAVGQRPGALELLLRAAQVPLPSARTQAVKALAALACNCEAVSREICKVDQSLVVLLSICNEYPTGKDEVRTAAIKTLVNLVDALLESRALICEVAHALAAIVNVTKNGTDSSKGNACYLLANLLELSMRVVEDTVAIPGAVEALVDVVASGTDFAMGNASRALGNIVDENVDMGTVIVANEHAVNSLIKVAQNGRDKSRGNACQAIGKLCEPYGALDAYGNYMPQLVSAIRRHCDMIGNMEGAISALLRASIDCEPDVQIQSTHALSLVIREHKHNCDALAAYEGAFEALLALVNSAGHKAVAGACRVLANVCDVYAASPLAALQLAHTDGALDALVGVLTRVLQDRIATVEAARALANLVEPEAPDSNDLSVAQAALHAEGVPNLGALVMRTRGVLAALVGTCYAGADEAKEHAIRCLACMAGTSNLLASDFLATDALASEIAVFDGSLAAMVQLCKSGSDLARVHATQALLNLCARELEILDSFMDGIYALRDLVQEALNPPPVVVASFVMNGVFTFSRKQKAWISGALARLLDLPPNDVTVTNVALFGTNVGCIVHLLIQLPVDSGDQPERIAHAVVEKALSGELAGELQELGISVTRTTLAVDPHVTKKQVFKPQQLDPQQLDLADADRGEASALAPHAPGHDMLYKPHTDAELSTIANQTVYMQLLSNRDLAVALRRNNCNVAGAWDDLCAAGAAPRAAEALATRSKVDGDDVPAAAEEREHGVGGMRRIIAQADVVRGAFEVLPRATRVCEELDCLDALLKIASGMVVWDGEEEMGLEKRKVLVTQPHPLVADAQWRGNIALRALAGYRPQDRVSNIKEHGTARLEFADTMAAVVDILRYGSALSREHAALALLNLCTGEHRFGRHLTGARALSIIAVAMKEGSLQGRINACSLLACLSADVEHGRGFSRVEGLLEWTVLMGEEGEGDDGVMAAREVAGLLLSNLAADKENALAIADTHRAVSMLANCVVEGNVIVGTLATRALCNMPLSERLPESGSIAHVRAQWFITSTYLTQEFMGEHDFCDTRDAPKGLIQILLEGRPQCQIEAAAVLLKLSGEPPAMQLLLETPGTFQVLVDMLGLSSHMASESACALCYRISLERNYRPELGGISRCLEELANAMDTGTIVAQHMAGGCLLNLIDCQDNQARLVEAHNVLNILLRLGEEAVNQMVKRCAVGVLRQVVDGVGGFKAMRIKRRVEGMQLR